LYRGISAFKDYQSRTNIVKDERSDLVADCHSIWLGGGNISQLLNVHGVSNAKQTEIHTEEPLVLETNAFEVEMANEKLKGHISQGSDQIPAELIKAGGRKICSEIHKLITSMLNKEKLEEWKESIIVPIYKKGVVIIEAYHF